MKKGWGYFVVFWLFINLTLMFSFSWSSSHIISPGNNLQISVWGTEEDLSRQAIVKADGNIFFPWVGEIKAAGLTFEQLAEKIKERLSRYFKNFEVAVTLAEIKPQFSILGQITSPGTYDLPPGLTVTGAISMAGGVTPLAYSEIKVVRDNKEIIVVNLNDILNKGDLKQNIYLQPGDIIYIPESENKITVLGQVVKPGEYELMEGWTVAEAIATAGGLVGRGMVQTTLFGQTIISARPGAFKVTIRRKGKEVYDLFLDPRTLSVRRIEGDEKDVSLHPGDIIFVREMKNTVIILGQVRREGAFEFREGDRVTNAIALAGGFAEKPHLKQVGIIREEEEGKTKLLIVNLENVLRKGKLEEDILLKDRDIVFVPKRTRLITFDTILNKIGKLYNPVIAIDTLRRLLED